MTFPTKTIRDVTGVLIDYRGKTPTKTTSGVKLITAKVIKDGYIVDGEHEYIADDDYDGWMRRGLPKQWDILITTEAPLGEVAQLRTPERIALAQRVILLRGNPNVIDQHFYFQALKSPFVQAGLKARSSGTTVLGIKQSELWHVEIPYPDLPTQHRISSILTAYDDLIENNTRRIRILEDMAQMIYREWLVNFRFPGHKKVRMVESELGPIPEGWLRPYQEYVDFLEGPGLRRWQYREQGIPFLNIRTITDNDIDLTKTQFVDPEEVESKYGHFLLSEFDHVVSSSGTLGRIATVRRQHLPVMLNTSIIRMRPKKLAVGRWQLKHFLKSDFFQSQIRSFAIGAAQMNFGPSHLKLAKIVAPTDEVGSAYEALVTPSEELILNLIQKNKNLRTTRDLLLPKLISGEITVEAADEAASELVAQPA